MIAIRCPHTISVQHIPQPLHLLLLLPPRWSTFPVRGLPFFSSFSFYRWSCTMLYMMVASARKFFSATRSTRREERVAQLWREHTPLPKTLPHVELTRALPIIQPHACLHACMPSWNIACLHAVVELADDGELSRWHAKTNKLSQPKGSVDGIICFDRSTKHKYKGVSFFHAIFCRRRTTNIMSTVERWGLNPHCPPGKMFSRSQ